jgi:peptide-methionine (S)-S-oxide reductase
VRNIASLPAVRHEPERGYPGITTEVADAPPFYYAEGYHQQYLAKNPGGYCGIGGTGVKCG